MALDKFGYGFNEQTQKWVCFCYVCSDTGACCCKKCLKNMELGDTDPCPNCKDTSPYRFGDTGFDSPLDEEMPF